MEGGRTRPRVVLPDSASTLFATPGTCYFVLAYYTSLNWRGCFAKTACMVLSLLAPRRIWRCIPRATNVTLYRAVSILTYGCCALAGLYTSSSRYRMRRAWFHPSTLYALSHIGRPNFLLWDDVTLTCFLTFNAYNQRRFALHGRRVNSSTAYWPLQRLPLGIDISSRTLPAPAAARIIMNWLAIVPYRVCCCENALKFSSRLNSFGALRNI